MNLAKGYCINCLDHSTFGGLINLSDFCTEHPRNCHSAIAERIVSDTKFDKQCMRNIENRNRKSK